MKQSFAQLGRYDAPIANTECPTSRSSSSLFRAGEERPRPLRVVSYNVLAQSLLNQTPQLYSNCSANALDAGLRRQRLVHLISNLDADIVALQEVEDFDNVRLLNARLWHNPA
eukprot:6214498-Pleurochrysis_carterae.AAC.1